MKKSLNVERVLKTLIFISTPYLLTLMLNCVMQAARGFSAGDVAKCSPTSTTETNTSNTLAVSTREIASSRATFAPGVIPQHLFICTTFWRCPHSMRCSVYVTVWCPSVCLSRRSTSAARRSMAAGSRSVDSCRRLVPVILQRFSPSALWHCRLGVRESIRPVKIKWWGIGVVMCLERGADCLHMVQLMPLPYQNPTISCLI